MVYVDFSAGNKDYKLRLSTRNLVALEKALGYNPIFIFGTDENNVEIPSMETIATVLHYSLQQLNHGISLDDTYNILDQYLDEEDHAVVDFPKIIIDVYRVSGLLKEEPVVEDENKIEKN